MKGYGLNWSADFVQDLRYVYRTTKKSPGFAAAVILTLALGMGANAAVFSVINAVLFKPLAYPEPGRIVMLMNTLHGQIIPGPGATVPKIAAWRESTNALTDVATFVFGRSLDVTDPGNPRAISIARVSEEFFRLFGARTQYGRIFTQSEDRPGGPRVVVVSDAFWRRELGGAADAVGRTLWLDGDRFTIVGVLDADFDSESLKPPGGVSGPTAVWLPLQVDWQSDVFNGSNLNYYLAAARLRPDTSFEVAQAQTQRAADAVRRMFPHVMTSNFGLGIARLHDVMVHDIRASLWLLWAAAAFVLLIACANTINLLLVRTTVREREIAIRVATGATFARIARQLMTEGVVLALVGALVGLALGTVGTRALMSIPGWAIPWITTRLSDVTFDRDVFALTFVITAAVGLTFGLVPAYRGARVSIDRALRSGRRAGSDIGQSRGHAILVASEMALALTLLVGSSLLIRTVVALEHVDPGFDGHGVLTAQTAIIGRAFATPEPIAQLARTGVDRLSVLAGVEGAAASLTGAPLDGDTSALNIGIVGRPRDDEYSYAVYWNVVSPRYFDVLKIPILRGRGFTDVDRRGATPVALISNALARRYWPGGDPLGDSLVIGPQIGGEFEETVPRQIIGIVGDLRRRSLRYSPHPAVYIPVGQLSDNQASLYNRLGVPVTWLVRTREEPRVSGAWIEREIKAFSRGLPLLQTRSMDTVVASSMASTTVETSLVTLFGSIAILLAGVGLFGVTSYSVEQRRREIGIRIALGAEPSQVRRMVLRDAAKMTAFGVAAGVAGALALTRFIAGLLFGVSQHDAASVITVVVILGSVTMIAAWIPATRASAVEPVIALRAE
jgi:predicted permease